MRTFLSTALIVLLAVLTPPSAIAAWTRLEIGDSGRFVSVMAPLSSNTDVRNAVTDRITDAAMRRIDAGPLQDQVRRLIHEHVRAFTTTEVFKTIWQSTCRATQVSFERGLTDGNDSTVAIDLAPVAAQVKQQLVADGVPFAGRIPAIPHTRIPVVKPDALGARLDVLRGLRTAGIWPAVGTVLLAVSAVVMAIRRRRAAIGAALAFAVGGVLLGITVRVGRGLTLNDLSAVDRPASAAVYDALTASLRTAAWAAFATGSALALVTWLTGLDSFTGHLRRTRPGADRP